MDPDLLDRLFPVLTLLLGAGLTSVQHRTTGRGQARREAADLLAEHGRYVWAKDDDNS